MHRQEVAQGRGTGGDSGAAGSRGRRGEPRVATGAAGGRRSCIRSAGSGGAARETARGYRERHTPSRAGPHGAAPWRPLDPRGGGAGQRGARRSGGRAPRLSPRPGRSRRGPGLAPLPSSASKIACAILERRRQRRRQGAPAARYGPTARERWGRFRGWGCGSCSTRGAAERHYNRPGRDRPSVAPALFGLPLRPRRPRPPAHDRAAPGQAHRGARHPHVAGGRDASLGPHWLQDRLSPPMRGRLCRSLVETCD